MDAHTNLASIDAPLAMASGPHSQPVPILMTKEAIEAELRRLAPFHHDVALPCGLRTYLPEASRQERERTRLQCLIDHAWPALLDACGGSLRGLRVLDVACNCGGFSVAAANSGADYVLGFDVNDHYLEQAQFIKKALNLRNVEFRKLPLESLDASVQGTFDVTFCFGILYHMENPILGMKKIAAVTDKLIMVDTSVLRVPYLHRLIKWPLWRMQIVPAAEESATNISTSRWRRNDHCQFRPNAPAVKELLQFLGFSDVIQLKPQAEGLEKRYYNGSRVTFIGRRM